MKEPAHTERHEGAPASAPPGEKQDRTHVDSWCQQRVEPQLGRGESAAHQHGAQEQVDQIGEDRTEKKESHVHFRIAEDPSEQPEGRPHVPKEHDSGDEDPSAVDTSG